MKFDKSQLMRGTLEGSILVIIKAGTTYGYEILEKLRKVGFADISEGSIYPILMRLEKQGQIKSEMRPSPLGPKRKYYTITGEGIGYVESFEVCWENVRKTMDCVLREYGGKNEKET